MLALAAHAQQTREQMPVVGSDGSITFQFACPEADEVNIVGLGDDDIEMTQRDGVWTCHLDSLPSEMYAYRYCTGRDRYCTDPLNPCTVRDITDTLSYFILPGYPGSYYIEQQVPHGKVEQLWYDSSFDSDMPQRRLSVYLPPTYEADQSVRFPVLYLLHGTGGDEMAWLDMGRLAQIMDNMIAKGRCKPMIVVMPNGLADMDAAPGASRYLHTEASHSNIASWMGRTEKAFAREVMPFIEGQFRTQADKGHRAIAGLSMGGLHTMAISANNPQAFDYVGLFSPQTMNALTDGNIKRIQRVTDRIGKIKSILPNRLKQKYDEGREAVADVDIYQNLDDKLAAQFATAPKLYYIAIGKKDPLKTMLTAFRNRLSKLGCTYMYKETEGAHQWENWRKYLIDFLPRIF